MKEEEIIRKIEKIENNCINTAKAENEELKKQNDEIEKKLLEEKTSSYEAEINKKLANDFGKLHRDYNKNIFDYNMESKKKITQFKDTLILNIHKMLIRRFIEFTDTNEYVTFLKNSIRQVLDKVDSKSDCKVYITSKDSEKYKEELAREFEIDIREIGDENIGGCMLLNEREKISIDNTIKNNIYERVKKITI